MDECTKEALEASIAKWEGYSKATSFESVHLGINACPLCRLFFISHRCNGCPVYKYTRQRGCAGTPYEQAEHAHYESDLEAFKMAAADEHEFLKSLREAE